MQSSISWEAYEYLHIPKSSDWYWSLIVISISIAIASIIFGNIIFAVLVIISAITLGMHAKKEPRIVSYEINEKGVRAGKVFYPYTTLESFAIDEHEVGDIIYANLLIKSKKTMMPLIVMPIAEVHPDDVREYASIFLPEEHHRETLGEKLMELLGF